MERVSIHWQKAIDNERIWKQLYHDQVAWNFLFRQNHSTLFLQFGWLQIKQFPDTMRLVKEMEKIKSRNFIDDSVHLTHRRICDYVYENIEVHFTIFIDFNVTEMNDSVVNSLCSPIGDITTTTRLCQRRNSPRRTCVILKKSLHTLFEMDYNSHHHQGIGKTNRLQSLDLWIGQGMLTLKDNMLLQLYFTKKSIWLYIVSYGTG